MKNQFDLQHPCPLNKEIKIFLFQILRDSYHDYRMRSWQTWASIRSDLVVDIPFKRSTFVWTAWYHMKSSHGRLNDWWEMLPHFLGAATCVLKESLLIFLMTLFPWGEKEERFLVPELEFVFFSLSAAACFVPVRKPWTVLLHPWQAAVVRFAWSCTYKVH